MGIPVIAIIAFAFLDITSALSTSNSTSSPTKVANATAIASNATLSSNASSSATPSSSGPTPTLNVNISASPTQPASINLTTTAAPTSSRPANNTAVPTSNETKTTGLPSTGLCQTYNGGGTCARFRNNRRVFVDPRPVNSQKNVSAILDQLFLLLSQYVDDSPHPPQCEDIRTEFLCSYYFPDCIPPTGQDTGVTFAKMCKESCSFIFSGNHACKSLFVTSQGAGLVFVRLKNYDTIQTDVTDLTCVNLPTALESNSTCMDYLTKNLTALTVTPTPAATTTAAATVDHDTCNGRGVNGQCHFPFQYLGFEFNSCTTIAIQYSNFRPWCATQGGNFYSHFNWRNCDCSKPVKLNSTCETYREDLFGNLCYNFRGNLPVFVDNSQLENTIKVTDFIATLVAKDQNHSCSDATLQSLCYALFPECLHNPLPLLNETIFPGVVCKEACNSVFHNCLDPYLEVLEEVKKFVFKNDIKLVQFSLDTPECGGLPSENGPLPCMTLEQHKLVGSSTNTTSTQPPTEITTTSLLIYVLPSVAGGLVILTVVLTVTCVWYNKRRKKVQMHVNSAYYSSQNGVAIDAESSIGKVLEKKLSRPLFGVDMFLENPAYSSSDIQDISLDEIEYVRPLGEGAFGQVFMGLVSRQDGKIPVAVKVLKAEGNDKVKEDFQKELQIMIQLRHPHVVSLLAKCISEEPFCMVFEFMCYGDLNEFIRDSTMGETTQLDNPDSSDGGKKYTVAIDDLKRMVVQICEGLKYLQSRRFVHRDIATRNCLVGKLLTTKISDFGLSRDIYASDYYRVGGKSFLPIRWMPPESIVYGKFTVKSDVWSLGVVMWEVFTLGKQPYYGISNEEVISFVVKGGRLSSPDSFCPQGIFEIMQKCWNEDPEERPVADEVIRLLTQE